MDAQYPFASRDDIWRVLDELKELQVAQYEQGERLARLERRRDDDARLRSLWGPSSPFPTLVASSIPAGKYFDSPSPSLLTEHFVAETTFNSPPDPFKGFDEGHHHGMAASTVGLDGEEEPRRGTSRANSVRFDESANHGYYGQANRSSTDLPVRTGSGMGSHPLTERSLSHRSDGRMSSSGFSHQSARTNSLGLESRGLSGSSLEVSPMTPPPGLFLLGPVPSIIRCWLTDTFSNEALLYAAVCSGSYVSSLGTKMITKLGLEESVMHNEEQPYIKLPLYLTEARVQTPSSRPASPQPQLPSLKVKFLVRETGPEDDSIQIIIGSDVLRSCNAEISFVQDKMTIVDDEGNRVCIPLVRPEKDSVFKHLCTGPDTTVRGFQPSRVNGKPTVGFIGLHAPAAQSTSAPASTRVSIGESDEAHKLHLQESGVSPICASAFSTSATATDSPHASAAKSEGAGVWGPWRRESKSDNAAANKASNARARTMKVLRPTKSSSRVASASTPTSATSEHVEFQNSHSENTPPGQPVGRRFSDENRSGKAPASNPIGGASAFGWLNSSSSGNNSTRQS